MADPAKETIDSFERWCLGFNTRDVDMMMAEMHFPHMRLSGSQFQSWPTEEDFRAPQDAMTENLRAEGWHTTETKSIEAVQVGDEKVPDKPPEKPGEGEAKSGEGDAKGTGGERGEGTGEATRPEGR